MIALLLSLMALSVADLDSSVATHKPFPESLAMSMDSLMPVFHVSELHSTRVDAPTEVVYDEFRRVNLKGSVLSWVFTFPRRFANLFRRRKKPVKHLNLATFEKGGFFLLSDDGHQEILVGMIESMGGGAKPGVLDAGQFKGFREPGFAKILWSIRVKEVDGASLLQTETRVHCTDPRTRRIFRVYWFFIQPFSGLTRRDMLRAFRARAELAGAR